VRPHYGAWGESVETAEALAHAAAPGTAVVSPTTQALIRDTVALGSGAVAEVPGRGHMKTWILRPDVEAPLTT
jgi:hypothetical protein